MPKRKITSLNMGATLTYTEKGKEKKITLTGVAPSPSFTDHEALAKEIIEFIQTAGKSKEKPAKKTKGAK